MGVVFLGISVRALILGERRCRRRKGGSYGCCNRVDGKLIRMKLIRKELILVAHLQIPMGG